VALAFNAGLLVDDVGNAVAFANGLGGTFRYAGAAGDAFFGDFHGHIHISSDRFVAALN